MPAEEAISVVFQSCFSQFLGNLPVLERGDSIEAVHQMRVAMRRLRSAFGLVYRLSPSPEFDALRTESKRIGTLLGQARDWDVFVQTIRDGPLPGFADAPGFDKFIRVAQSKAEAAHGAVTRLANDRTVARFALRLDRFVGLRGWRGDPQSDRSDWLSESIVDFAIKSLNRLHRRLLRRGKGFRSQSLGERHALRIAAKHMRYAVEFFGSLFHPHSAAERYIDKAQALQDLLGQMDLEERGLRASANRLFNRYLAPEPPDAVTGLVALPLFLSLRAAIRAKVEAASAERLDRQKCDETRALARRYFDCAVRFLAHVPPRLVAVSGLSGVGKSALAGALAPEIGQAPGALWLRSDLERKSMSWVEETVGLPASAYSSDVTRDVYERLIDKARIALRAGQAVLLDATFATSAERSAAAGAAAEVGVAFAGLFLDAPLALRLARIDSRRADASDADADVARRQSAEPLDEKGWAAVPASGSLEETTILARARLDVL